MTDTMAVVATNVNKPPIVIMRERLEARKGELKAALTDVTPEQFIRAVITSATINPEIQACTWQSVWIACMQACRDNLLPDGVEGAIVPFKSKAQWLPMYQGLLRRFRRSGQFKSIVANVVRDGEQWMEWYDETGPHFRHVPGDSFETPIVRVYASATTKDGGFFLASLPIAEANKIRNMSRASRDDSPWKQWPEEMYKKTALRRLSKVLPSGRDIIGDEEVPEFEAPVAASPTPIARAPGAAAALEQFAASSPTVSDTPVVREEEEQGATDAASARRIADERDPAPADDHYAHFQHVAAYKRGQEAKAAGHLRKAIPPEFREPNATRLALAWEAGWSGQPMPEFTEQDHD
jgi:recombination protein RecT